MNLVNLRLRVVTIKNAKSMLYETQTLSNPSSASLLPMVGPIPERSVTGFSPIGSDVKMCTWDFFDIF